MKKRKKLFLSPSRREALLGFAFILPMLVLFGIFVYRPLVETFMLSFTNWNMISPQKSFVGLDNYIELFASAQIYKAFINTILYVLFLIAFIILLPLSLIAGMTYVKNRARKIYRVILFSPTLISLGISSIVWLWLFNPINGLLGKLFKAVGLEPINWLSNPQTALIAIGIIVAWKAFGYNLLLFMAGLGGVSVEMIEAARVDGAEGVRLWRYIVLPLMSPTTLFIFVATLSMAAEYVYTPIDVLTGGGPSNATTNMVYEIYRQAFTYFRIGYSSALSVTVFIFFFLLMILQIYMSRKVVSYEER